MTYKYSISVLILCAALMGGTPAFAQEEGQAGQNTGVQQPVQQNKNQFPQDMRKPDGDMRKDTMNPRDDFQGQGMKAGEKMMNTFGKKPMNNQMQGNKPPLGDKKEMMQGTQGKEGMMQKNNKGSKQDQGQMMGSEGQSGEQGRQGEMMEGDQQGPREEEMGAQQKKMDEQRFKQMKKGLSQFKQGTTRMKSEISRMEKTLTKCGVGIPDELKKALSDSEAVVPKIEAAQDIDALEAVMDEIESSGDAMKEWGPKMGKFQQLCEMLKRADQELKRVKKDVTRLEKRVGSQKKYDLSELIAEVKDLASKLEASLVDAKAKGKTDPEEAIDVLKDEFFENMSDLSMAQQGVEMALDVTKGLKDADREIKKYDGLAKKLKNQKKDTAELEGQIADLKTKRKEVADLLAKKKFDADDLVSLINEASDARNEVVNTLEDFGALQDFMPQFKQGQGVDFQLPQGFEKQQQSMMQQFEEKQGGQQNQDMKQPSGSDFNSKDIQSFFQSKKETVASL